MLQHNMCMHMHMCMRMHMYNMYLDFCTSTFLVYL